MKNMQMPASVPGGPHQSHIDLCEEWLQFSANQLVLKRGQAVSLEPAEQGMCTYHDEKSHHEFDCQIYTEQQTSCR